VITYVAPFLHAKYENAKTATVDNVIHRYYIGVKNIIIIGTYFTLNLGFFSRVLYATIKITNNLPYNYDMYYVSI